MSGADPPGGPLDVPTLRVLGQRALAYPIVDSWSFRPDALSPRQLELTLDADQFPATVGAIRLNVRWFEGGEYTFHYLAYRGEDVWQCRWDRHPKPEAPNAHFHLPPDAAPVVEPSDVDSTHHLGVCFFVLDWIEDRLAATHGSDN